MVAAEELSDAALKEDEPPTYSKLVDTILDEPKITDTQLNFIEIMCRNDSRGLNINIKKLVDKMYPGVYNIKELSHANSLTIQKMLSNYQQDKGLIPLDIVGFDSNWKKGD